MWIYYKGYVISGKHSFLRWIYWYRQDEAHKYTNSIETQIILPHSWRYAWKNQLLIDISPKYSSLEISSHKYGRNIVSCHSCIGIKFNKKYLSMESPPTITSWFLICVICPMICVIILWIHLTYIIFEIIFL